MNTVADIITSKMSDSQYYYILDNNGETVATDAMSWAKWFEENNRVLIRSNFTDGTISTVFLGLNHQYGEGPPLLFETLVFGGKLDGKMNRYSSKEEALIGHGYMMKCVEIAEK